MPAHRDGRDPAPACPSFETVGRGSSLRFGVPMRFWSVAVPGPKGALTLGLRELDSGPAAPLVPQGQAFWAFRPIDTELGGSLVFSSAKGEVRAGGKQKSFWEFLEDSIIQYFVFWELLSKGTEMMTSP